jgi:hypothetical protein
VLGTTLIVATTKNGGFKVLLIEGKGSVRAGDGSVRGLGAGQMVYALPGGRLSGVFEFRLAQQVGAAQLIRGFKTPLASTAKIQAAIAKQEKEIAGGEAVSTNLLATGTPGVAVRVDVAREALIEEETGDDDTEPADEDEEPADEDEEPAEGEDADTYEDEAYGDEADADEDEAYEDEDAGDDQAPADEVDEDEGYEDEEEPPTRRRGRRPVGAGSGRRGVSS